MNTITTEKQIEVTDLESPEEKPNTEDQEQKIEMVFPPLEEEEEDSDYFDELQNVILDDEAEFLNSENFSEMKKGLVSLECGINSVCIPVNPQDVGSIIAYSLSTNCYYEGLARQNYMEFQSKIDQNSVEEHDLNNKLNSKSNPSTAGPKDYIERASERSNQNQGLQNQLNNVKAGNESKKKERIFLNDKTDVLDSEYQPHHIESEFLSYEKINFKLKWSTAKKDMRMKVFKNIFRVDHIHGNVQEY